MDKKINPNLFPNDKEWIETVNENFDKFITIWVSSYKNGELLKEDIMKVVERIAEIRKDNNLVENIKQRFAI